MKKLLGFLTVAAIVLGCSGDYNDIKPKQITGVKLEIDSTQWKPALVQIEDEKVVIYEKGEIREVAVVDKGDTAGFVVILLVLAFLFGLGVGYKE